MPQDKLIDPSSITNLHRLSPTIGCCTTGMVADSRAQIQKARQECMDFTHEFSYAIPPNYLAQKMADKNQVYTQHAYCRPLGVCTPPPAPAPCPCARCCAAGPAAPKRPGEQNLRKSAVRERGGRRLQRVMHVYATAERTHLNSLVPAQP